MSVSRRQFLTYVGVGTYAALRQGHSELIATASAARPRTVPKDLFFKPIRASAKDAFEVPEAPYDWHLVCKWDDDLGLTDNKFGPQRFGFNNDFLAYFPMDALGAGKNTEEGLLWVNHEYPDPKYVSKYPGERKKTKEEIHAEKRCVGGSIVHVKREGGVWKVVPGPARNRRFTAQAPMISFSGPASVLGEAAGTLANCSGGHTPWQTALSCEENFQDYNSTIKYGYRWSDDPLEEIDERHYGWVVEIDPFGELPPIKHTALGRFAHENAALYVKDGEKLVVYMGDDANDQYVYKFVSAGVYRPAGVKEENKQWREQTRKLLMEGMLYAADFAEGKWLPLDVKANRKLRAAGFLHQGDVVLRAREAAKAAGATPVDRPEDCELHADGSLYIAMTNNVAHGNLYGQVVRLTEDKGHAGEDFHFEIFLAGGPQSGLACPDNLAFDRRGNLWVACDMSGRVMHKGAMKSFGNNGLFVVPTEGDHAGDAFQFASGPPGSELTGPCFTPNGDTLFLSVQHPGEEGGKSVWPPKNKGGDGKLPYPAVVAITGFKW